VEQTLAIGGNVKTLLGIFTAHKYVYCSPDSLIKDWFTRPVVNRVQAVRDTWLKDVTYDYRFFYGKPATVKHPLPDEVFLDAPDDYLHSTGKLRAMIRYALDNGYDRLLKIDDDVFVHWDRLLANVPEGDYCGGGPFGGHPFGSYCSGAIYWLSRRAMEIIVAAPEISWAEDRHVGEVMKRAGIAPHFEFRYFIAPPTRRNQYISDEALAQPNDYITIHSLSPEQMRRHWRKV
jgi:hypothetical protein